ncbi:MAG: hypothetical protein NT157_03555 [Candidatus Micrarchaeota archaeon]|nr:hypothetical protein [Candidatus Micrarchaeota archaeon]
MRLAFLLPILLLASAAFADFRQTHLDVVIDVKSDGTAVVQEDLRMFIDEGNSVIYNTAMAKANDISGWKAATGLGIRYHFNRDEVDINEVVIRAQPLDTCSQCQISPDTHELVCQTCYGTLRITYIVTPISGKNGSGLFTLDAHKPRTTNYTLNRDALSFEATATGEIVLDENTELVMFLPSDAVITKLSPKPENLADSRLPIYGADELMWKGRTTLAAFQLEFQTEEPLSQEVMDFFVSLQRQVVGLLYSPQGLAVAILFVVFVITVIVLGTRKKE